MDILLAQTAVTLIIGFVVSLLCLSGSILYKILRIKLKPNSALAVSCISLGLFIFKHYIFYNALFFYYAPSPTQYVSKKIEAPISVMIQDKGLRLDSKYKHQLLVKKYLDGIHLKTLAIHVGDDRFYLYETKTTDLNFKEIMKNVKIYDSYENLPKMNFHIKINSINHQLFKTKRFHADITKIIDTKKNEEIAFSYRYWSYATFLSKLLSTEKADRYGVRKGVGPYEFLEATLFNYPNRMKLTYLEKAQNLDNR